jgi:hypothetical protein
MVTKKDRRHSGYVTPRATVSKQDLFRDNHFINEYYDPWNDYRDGQRDWFSDFKSIKNVNSNRFKRNEGLYIKRIHMNLKQKKLLIIRKKRKIKLLLTSYCPSEKKY